jgi:hypothetical protein
VVSDEITPKETDGKSFAYRYNILRTQVLEIRTKEGGASVKDFAVPR